MSFTCQRSFGPSVGHCLRRPVSEEMPLRSGPRHCGQSLAEVVTESAEQHKQSVARVASNRDFTVDLLLGQVITFVGCRALEVRIQLRKCFVTILERPVIWSNSQQLLL